jgi:four helix bundle protein
MAKKIDELPVYKRAVEFCRAITAILEGSALRRDRELHKQISAANDSITANMEEGFEQSTDRHFANFLFTAKGSLAEVLGRLKTARRKRRITQEQLDEQLRTGEELGRMLGGFIRYLNESDFKDRGRFTSKHTAREPSASPPDDELSG